MNENSKNAIDLAYDGDIASMQSAIEDAIKDKIASAFEYKKQEIAQQLINNEEKCCDELSSKQKKEMDVDDDEDIDEKDLAALRKKKLNKESVEELQELSKNTLRKYIGKNVASTMHTNSDDIPKNRKKGLKTAYDKLNKESAEELQELSNKTLNSYIKKATYDDQRDPEGERRVKKGRERGVVSASYRTQGWKPSKTKKGEEAWVRYNKESYIEEKLSVEDGVKAWIDDFIKSDDPRFEGKSKEERRKQAIAAFYSAKKGK